MTLRSVTELFMEASAAMLVACSLVAIVLIWMLLTGTLP